MRRRCFYRSNRHEQASSQDKHRGQASHEAHEGEAETHAVHEHECEASHEGHEDELHDREGNAEPMEGMKAKK